MPEYRIYQIKSGHIAAAAVVIDCASDEAAIAKGEQMVDGRDLEIWDGGRLVARMKSRE
ncbi:MAG: hypothetical protein ACR2K5_11120 [Pseudolabrys sp.]